VRLARCGVGEEPQNPGGYRVGSERDRSVSIGVTRVNAAHLCPVSPRRTPARGRCAIKSEDVTIGPGSHGDVILPGSRQ
jgi:hypothetical protein